MTHERFFFCLEMTTNDITQTIIHGEHNNQPQIAAGVKEILYDAHYFTLAVTKKVFSSLPHHSNEFACLRFWTFTHLFLPF